MSIPERLLLTALCVLSWSGAWAAAPGGVPLSADDVSAIDITVLTDGSGLPPGRGSVEQGAEVYARHCRACHGADAEGDPNDALAGGRGSLAGDEPQKTIGSYWPFATTVFDYVRRAMPYQAPGSLTDDEVYAVTAYLLFENGIVAADATLDANSLPQVVMPNRNGFSRP